MLDKFKIDSHKLMFHIERLQQWQRGENIYPVYIEIGLYGGCNQRCIFCAFDFMKYKVNILNCEHFKKSIAELRDRGIKAILYSGEGEPLLHKEVAGIINFTKKVGIDVALASNGVMLNSVIAAKILPSLSWLKISLNAGKKITYARVHRVDCENFNLVLSNLRKAVLIRNRSRYACTIGAQCVLLSQNFHEMAELAKKLRDLGLDYLVIKPYSQHSFSQHNLKSGFRHKDLLSLKEKLERYSKDNFQVIFRINAMEKINAEKPYSFCLGFTFITHITATGDVYPCTVFIGQKEFRLGNIYTESFRDIWEGERRSKIIKKIYKTWDIQHCRQACRVDEINRYLWELKHPVEHVNFI